MDFFDHRAALSGDTRPRGCDEGWRAPPAAPERTAAALPVLCRAILRSMPRDSVLRRDFLRRRWHGALRCPPASEPRRPAST